MDMDMIAPFVSEQSCVIWCGERTWDVVGTEQEQGKSLACLASLFPIYCTVLTRSSTSAYKQ